jgi:hypothetical protein
MKGKLIRVGNSWAVRFFDSHTMSTIPLHPIDNDFASLNEGSEVEFDIHDEHQLIEGQDRFAKLFIPHNF